MESPSLNTVLIYLSEYLILMLFAVDGSFDEEDLDDESGTTPRVDSHMRYVHTNGPSAQKDKGWFFNRHSSCLGCYKQLKWPSLNGST